MKIIGVIPARMQASRFPGKPLKPILGLPMIEHVFRRAEMFKEWDELLLATCDKEIEDFGKSKGWKVTMTSDKHTRCLDRVAEAIAKLDYPVKDDDIIVCVQGDEPLLHPSMINKIIEPCLEDDDVPCTVLTMDIVDENHFYNKDTVKVIHDLKGNVLYTSRAPVPYCEKFTADLGAKRIYGIFAFRWSFLQWFTQTPESPLELVESCDSNRILDNGFHQRIAPYPYFDSYAVDSPNDIALVERAMKNDPLWEIYKR